MTEISIDDVSLGALEWALAESAGADEPAQEEGDASPCGFNLAAMSTPKRVRVLRNFFKPGSYEQALANRESADPVVAAQCSWFLRQIEAATGRWCANTNCLKEIAQVQHGRRGRPQRYCTKRCADAQHIRDKRNRLDNFRQERLKSFELPYYARAGYSGKRRRCWSTPTSGFDSVIGLDVRTQMHADAVSGSVRASERVARVVDAAWSERHEKALTAAGSLENQIEERGAPNKTDTAI